MESTISLINKYGTAIVNEHSDYRPTKGVNGQLIFKKKGKGRWQEEVYARLYDHSNTEDCIVYRNGKNTFRYEIIRGQTNNAVIFDISNQPIRITGDNLSKNTAKIAFDFHTGTCNDATIEFNMFEDTSLYSSICIKIDNSTIWSLIMYDECAQHTFNKQAYYTMLANEFKPDDFMALITNVLMYYKNNKGFGVWNIDTLKTFEVIKPGLMACIKDFIEIWKNRIIQLSNDPDLCEPRATTVENAMEAIRTIEASERKTRRGNK